MLVKLFKHDFKALSRTLCPVLIAIGAAALLAFVDILIIFGDNSILNSDRRIETGLSLSAAGGLILMSMTLAAAFTVFAVLIFVRFYRSMVTDEAYLTFTLPVSAGTLITGKFLVSLVWMVIGAAAVTLTVLLMFTGLAASDPSYTVAQAWHNVWQDVKSIFIDDNVGRFVLVCILGLLSVIRTYFQITGAILFGASVVRKHKALAAVGMIFAFNFAVNVILSVCGVSGMVSQLFYAGILYEFSEPGTSWYVVQIAVNLFIALLFWWISVRIAKKSVNIE